MNKLFLGLMFLLCSCTVKTGISARIESTPVQAVEQEGSLTAKQAKELVKKNEPKRLEAEKEAEQKALGYWIADIRNIALAGGTRLRDFASNFPSVIIELRKLGYIVTETTEIVDNEGTPVTLDVWVISWE